MDAYSVAFEAGLVDAVGTGVKERRDIQSEAREAARRARPLLVRMSDLQPEDISWIWQGRIARGKLSLIVGDPGTGKSTLTLDIAARMSRGAAWPDSGIAPVGNVILMSGEDGLSDTVAPRLRAAGADASRISSLQQCVRAGVERGISLATDLDLIRHAVKEETAALVIIDPLSAYMGDVDTHKEAAVRRVLDPVAAMAEELSVGILWLLHLNKGAAQNLLYRTSGSIGYVAVARLVFGVVPESESEGARRVFGWIKGNIGRRVKDLAYQLEPVSDDIACVRWSSERPSQSLRAILQSAMVTEDEDPSVTTRSNCSRKCCPKAPSLQKTFRRKRRSWVFPSELSIGQKRTCEWSRIGSKADGTGDCLVKIANRSRRGNLG